MRIKFHFLSLLLCVLCLHSFAQTEIPYSRYGLGILQRPEPAFLRGWGGLTAAFHNAYSLNYGNPASYAYLNYTVLEAGLFGSSLKLQTTDDSMGYFRDGGLATLALAFPVIKNKLGVSTGIVPYSRVSYEIRQNNDSVPGLGATYNDFNGDGGLYKYYLGAGYKWKNLSFGANAEYLFGKVDYSTVLAFPDTQNAYNTLRDESRSVGDIVFTGGLQYRFVLGAEKNYFLDLGVTGNLKSNVNAERNLMFVRFTYSVDATPIPKDTIYNQTDENGTIVLPASFSGGIMFSKASRYMIGVNYQYSKWSDYLSFGEKDLVSDSWRVSTGLQVVPDYKSYTQYPKLIAYRAGFSMGKNYLQFDGKDLPEYEVNIGAGFPLRRVLSELSVSGEWTHVGTLKENPLTISTFRITLGVTLDDRWFQKRKFD